MEKYTDRYFNNHDNSTVAEYRNGFPYSPEEIRKYISEIRLIITENPETLTDAAALEKI